ncbi:hypothetical protein ACQX0N_11270 [Clostridium tepidum]|jgi:hypothetical protein|uniref:Uncharacterized protein n=1 Tax=Clostridium tepidum TaxID=1962263 RepID=A0A1S9IHN1_9CLOT|nr:hypothetical protein [Clostridium tepidum]MDU6877617.1 hypothetical protein [Clostridium botulinum]OOO62538.1 hypothetical protein BS637_06795 [Clostridium tepidum]OOO69816.1 hypothetical protein BS638_00040 [Clostridium tepidum]
MITGKLLSRNFILAKNEKNRGRWIRIQFAFHVFAKYCIKELFMTFLSFKLTPTPYKKIFACTINVKSLPL